MADDSAARFLGREYLDLDGPWRMGMQVLASDGERWRLLTDERVRLANEHTNVEKLNGPLQTTHVPDMLDPATIGIVQKGLDEVLAFYAREYLYLVAAAHGFASEKHVEALLTAMSRIKAGKKPLQFAPPKEEDADGHA